MVGPRNPGNLGTKGAGCSTGSTDAIAGSIEPRIEAAVIAEDFCIEHHESRRKSDTELNVLEARQERSSSTDWKLGCFNISPTTRAGIVRISYDIY